MASFLKIAYFPMMIIVFIGVEIIIVKNGLAFYFTLFLMLFALIASFCIERVIPYKLNWNDSHKDFARDLMHFVVNETMNYSAMFLLPFLTVFAVFPNAWPSHWDFILQLILAIIVFDIGSTLFHYLSHKSSFLWRFHMIHHAPIRLYGFNGIMKHPLYQAMDAIFALGPLIIIGIPQSVAFALIFSIFIQLLIQHTNADIKTGIFRNLFATAELHRFHHLKGRAGDVNFALFFSVWDRLLGTSYFEKRSPLGEHEIGIGNASYPVDYWSQMKAPFSNKHQQTDSSI